MQPDYLLTDLLPVGAAFGLPGERPLRPAKHRQLIFEVFGIRDMLPVAGCQKRFNADVKTNYGEITLLGGLVRHLAADLDIPFVRFRGDRHGTNYGFFRQGAVLIDPDHADMLDTQAVPEEPDTIPMRGELDAGEPVTPFEAWVSGLFTGYYSTEKRVKCLVKPSHGGLSGAEVDPGEEGVCDSLFLEPGGLFSVPDASLFRLVSGLPLFEAGIVETPVGLQHDAQLSLLVPICPEPVFEGAQHLSALLTLDVMPNGFFTNAAHCAGIITPGPEGGEARLKEREFGSQYSGTCSLDPVNDLRHRPAWVGLDKEVDVVRHDLVNVNHGINFGSDIPDDFNQTGRNVIGQHRPTVFRAPDQVVLERENGAGVFCIACPHRNNMLQAGD